MGYVGAARVRVEGAEDVDEDDGAGARAERVEVRLDERVGGRAVGEEGVEDGVDLGAGGTEG